MGDMTMLFAQNPDDEAKTLACVQSKIQDDLPPNVHLSLTRDPEQNKSFFEPGDKPPLDDHLFLRLNTLKLNVALGELGKPLGDEYACGYALNLAYHEAHHILCCHPPLPGGVPTETNECDELAVDYAAYFTMCTLADDIGRQISQLDPEDDEEAEEIADLKAELSGLCAGMDALANDWNVQSTPTQTRAQLAIATCGANYVPCRCGKPGNECPQCPSTCADCDYENGLAFPTSSGFTFPDSEDCEDCQLAQ